MLKERFKAEMEKARTNYLPIIGGKKQDKAVEALLNYFLDEEIRNGYYRFFKELAAIYEIISPDAFLRDYIEDYETLSRMYRILRENYDRTIDIDKDFTRKTIELVKKHTKSGNIQPKMCIRDRYTSIDCAQNFDVYGSPPSSTRSAKDCIYPFGHR